MLNCWVILIYQKIFVDGDVLNQLHYNCSSHGMIVEHISTKSVSISQIKALLLRCFIIRPCVQSPLKWFKLFPKHSMLLLRQTIYIHCRMQLVYTAFGQLGVWQSSNDNWKHICSKMYLSNNYVDINIYPLTMDVMRLWACLYGKGAISNDNIIIITQTMKGWQTHPAWSADQKPVYGFVTQDIIQLRSGLYFTDTNKKNLTRFLHDWFCIPALLNSKRVTSHIPARGVSWTFYNQP